MKQLFFCVLCAALLIPTGCKKSDDTTNNTATEAEVLNDFAYTLANPNYVDINTKAATLNSAVQALYDNTTDANLTTARTAWRDVRTAWEQCEGYLFGPVEDFNYDPTMDDWPVNKVDLDSLLASSNPLALADIEALPTSLKGFHPIEYVLFGTGGTKTAAQITAREKQYILSLTQSLYNTTTDLKNSWDPNVSGNFTNELVNAGSGSQRFTTKKDAFLAIVTAMAGICDEVAGGKMEKPLVAQDSTLEESQFAHNGTADFKNNMIGVLNAYTCKYSGSGHSLSDLVAAKNLSLDNTLRTQINAAINSFDNINANYGQAIYTQQVQIHNTQDAINTLKATLEGDLTNFVQTNIND
jgi:uncharacterized iron-regulated protein